MASMYSWIETIDPESIPTPVLLSESARRRGRMVKTRHGSNPKWVCCLGCRQLYSRDEFRLHIGKRCHPDLVRGAVKSTRESFADLLRKVGQ